MGLKIEHLDETTLKGTLDGMIPVRGTLKEGTVRITIAGWFHEISADLLTGANALRYAIYPALAKYRNDQRFGNA